MSQTLTKNLSKFLELSDKAVNDVYDNPSQSNWKKLEQVTAMVKNQLKIDAKVLLDKKPTEKNEKLYRSIKNEANKK